MTKITVGQQGKTESFVRPAQSILQRTCVCGNHRTVGGECAQCAKNKSSLQRKHAIGASNDPLEQEADRVVDQVLTARADPAVEHVSPRIQPYATSATGQNNVAPPSVDRVVARPADLLHPALRQDMEQRFGHDFSQVRVHADDYAAESAKAIGAIAYTTGHHIVFNLGQYAPQTAGGRTRATRLPLGCAQDSGS